MTAATTRATEKTAASVSAKNSAGSPIEPREHRALFEAHARSTTRFVIRVVARASSTSASGMTRASGERRVDIIGTQAQRSSISDSRRARRATASDGGHGADDARATRGAFGATRERGDVVGERAMAGSERSIAGTSGRSVDERQSALLAAFSLAAIALRARRVDVFANGRRSGRVKRREAAARGLPRAARRQSALAVDVRQDAAVERIY